MIYGVDSFSLHPYETIDYHHSRQSWRSAVRSSAVHLTSEIMIKLCSYLDSHLLILILEPCAS